MSTINQHNYEEFFLLYADGELSATGKLAVDQFVQANPDLAAELDILLQLRLPEDDALVFGDKETLFRSEAAEINLNNCEEHFLLYVDNELTIPEKTKLETFVLQHPSLQESFTLLKQTRLEAATIVFPNKESLYRNEEKERPLFYLRWQQIAVAAAFIGMALLLWTVMPQNKIEQPLTAKQNAAIQPGSTTAQLKEPLPTTNNTAAPGNKAVTDLATSVNNNGILPIGNAKLPGHNNGNTLPVIPAEIKAWEPVRTGELAKAAVIAATSHHGFEKTTASTQSVSGGNTILEATDAAKTVASGPSAESLLADNVQPAVYRELDTEAADQKKSLLLGSLEINKDKLRGFFRKAGSIFRSKSKAEDDKTETGPESNIRSLK